MFKWYHFSPISMICQVYFGNVQAACISM